MPSFSCENCGKTISTNLEHGDEATCIFCMRRMPVPDGGDAIEERRYSNADTGPPSKSASRGVRVLSRGGSHPPSPWFQIALSVEALAALLIVCWPLIRVATRAATAEGPRHMAQRDAAPRDVVDEIETTITVARFVTWATGVFALALFISRGVISGWITNDSRKRMHGAGASWAFIVWIFGVWTVFVYMHYRDKT